MTCRWPRLTIDAPWDNIHLREVRKAIAVASIYGGTEWGVPAFTPIRLDERLGWEFWMHASKGRFFLRCRESFSNSKDAYVTELWCLTPDDELTLEATTTENDTETRFVLHGDEYEGAQDTDGFISWAIQQINTLHNARLADAYGRQFEARYGMPLLSHRRNQRRR